MRICHELLRMAAPQLDAQRQRGPAVTPAPKHAEIASRVNTHREAVTRLLGKLTKLGVVQRGRGELLIRDVQALEAYARQLHSS